MKFTRQYKTTPAGEEGEDIALVLQSGRAVAPYFYRNIRRLQSEFKALAKLIPVVDGKIDDEAIEILLSAMGYDGEFVDDVIQKKLITVKDGKSALSDSIFDSAVGIPLNDDPILEGILVDKLTKRKNFSQGFINGGIAEGWLSMGQGKITIHAKPAIEYRIIRQPGYYCCFDDAKLDGQQHGERYVATNYAGQTSPDRNNPAGYRKDNFFACELIEEAVNG